MKKAPQFDVLIEQIAQVEGELQQARGEAESLRMQFNAATKKAVAAESQAHFLYALVLGLLSVDSEKALYQSACKSIAHHLNWDTVFALEVRDKKVDIHCAVGATEKQAVTVKEQLVSSAFFHRLYAEKSVISTAHLVEREALQFRTLFHTDEAVALPLIVEEELVSYLVLCSHGSHSAGAMPDLPFLAKISDLVSQALYRVQ